MTDTRSRTRDGDGLKGKTALIVGGSRGIGKAIAIGLSMHGAQVVISYVSNGTAAREVAEVISDRGGVASAVQADLSRAGDVTRLFDEAEARGGRLDIVVASAADILVKPVVECTEEDFDRIFNLNAKGVFLTLREAARRLRDGGRIIALSTGGTRMWFPGQSLYLGSKAAVEQFVRALSWEVGGRGITVNTLSPGPTETDMMQDRYRDAAAATSPFNRIATPQDIADIAVFLSSGAARWITGQNIAGGGGAF